MITHTIYVYMSYVLYVYLLICILNLFYNYIYDLKDSQSGQQSLCVIYTYYKRL